MQSDRRLALIDDLIEIFQEFGLELFAQLKAFRLIVSDPENDDPVLAKSGGPEVKMRDGEATR